jgi:probable rRNA maturation factor
MRDKAPSFSVHFYFQHAGHLKDRQRLRAFIGFIFKKEKTRLASLTLIFCSDAYLIDINNRFLRHNFYTDILTFNLATKNAPIQGEIYISIERVRENALDLDQYYYKELHRVIFHGILHLCGYTDKTATGVALMRKKEDHYLSLYFVPRITVSP